VIRFIFTLTSLLLFAVMPTSMAAQETGSISGVVTDPSGAAVASARVMLARPSIRFERTAVSDNEGRFQFLSLDPGAYQLTAEAPNLGTVTHDISVFSRSTLENVKFRSVSSLQTISVVASAPDALTPDPSERMFIHDQLLEANPGHPGSPVSVPGLPIETASGGIKAPQYFAPGVAGDHGEPIAQFLQIGDFLFPNNLPANAHGNGYADPNILISSTIEAVSVDGGAFDVREGNNAVDLAATYTPMQRVVPFLQLMGDGRDVDAVVGWSPQGPATNAWLAAEASVGNGFLKRLEHRQQYKLNGLRQLDLGDHNLTFYGASYYGFSYVPGLIPIDVRLPGDTINSGQLDHTYNFVAAASDVWRLTADQQLSFSGFFRNYALTLRSDFGDGLIQQSEQRNVFGGEFLYIDKVHPWLSILAGADVRRDVPHNLNLKHLDAQNVFNLVTSNNLTLSFAEPFISIDGALGPHLHYDFGVRQEAVWMNNQDLLNPPNSFDKLASITLPKGTLTFLPGDHNLLPTVSLSYGEAFHAEDPRIGTGTAAPSLLASSSAYQLQLMKSVGQTRFSVGLRRVSNSQELAKIDPDTGLQEAIGPSLNKVLSLSLEHHFSRGSLFVSYAQADARQTNTGQPVPEAPRTIWDAVASENRLPFRLQAKAEFEYVKAKPLGDGFVGVPVSEVRGAVSRSLFEDRASLGVNFSLAHGYTGQTTEVLASPLGSTPAERAVGVPLKTFVSVSCNYYFGK
jgi:carboxypeptidase family protein